MARRKQSIAFTWSQLRVSLLVRFVSAVLMLLSRRYWHRYLARRLSLPVEGDYHFPK